MQFDSRFGYSIVKMRDSPYVTAKVEFYVCLDAITAADGTYLSEPLQPGSRYTVQAGGAGHRSRYYPDAAPTEGAIRPPVTVATTTPAIDSALPDIGHITGRVTDAATGRPVAGISVRQMETSWPTAWTGSDGRYDFDGLENGVYTLRFDDPEGRYLALTSPRLTVTIGAPATFDAALAWNGDTRAVWLPWVTRP